MGKNIRKKDHPIQFQIARLHRRCANNFEKVKLIGKGLMAIAVPLGIIYGARELPTTIEKIKKKQAENREVAMRRFEEMPAAERDKIWTQEQQEAIFEHIDKVRAREQ